MPHIGVAYLAANLRRNGFTVSVYDLSLKLYNNAKAEFRRFWQIDCVNSYFQSEIAEMVFNNFEGEIDEFIEDLMETGIRIIGFSVNLISIYAANRMAGKIKHRDPERLIVFGGQGTFSEHPRDQIKPAFADVYVIGEGEQVLRDIVDAYYNHREIVNGPGVLLANDLGVKAGMASEEVRNLDELPFPTFNGFDLNGYNIDSTYKPLPMLFSRGCVRRCAYCMDCVMWPRYRFRSPRHIMNEIEYHIVYNKTKAFEIIDLACNGNLKQLSGICDLIIDSGAQFSWVSYALVRGDMDRNILSKMKRAGCHTLIYGVESGSDHVLKKMGKGYASDQAQEVIKLTYEAGICVNINIIVGFPGETDDDFNETLKFIVKNKKYINEVTNVSGCTLFPLADMGKNRQKYEISWEEHTDPMLFKDSNGIGRNERNNRVEVMIEEISSLGLSRAIINKPAMNPNVKAVA